MGVEIPERAEYLRVIWHELRVSTPTCCGWDSRPTHSVSRACSCTAGVCASACWDIFEKTTGGRVIFSVVKVGGVVRDIDDAQFAR